MRKLLFILFMGNMLVISQTYHTITIDGTNDFNLSAEQFNTTSGTTLLGYITWDANLIYLGFSGSTPAGPVTDANRVYHVYIDTDPQPNPKDGTGTINGELWRWAPILPFTANYHYSFKTVDNTEYKRVYNGSNWSNATFTTSNYKGAGFWELSITRSGIGSPSQIYILMYVEEDWGGGFICGGVPSNLFTNTSTSGSITFNSHWYGYNLTSGVTPNDGSNLDTPLPVELTSFTASVDGKVVTLNWETATEVNNYGFEVDRLRPSDYAASWEKIGFVEGHGNSNSPKQYTFTDNSVLFGSYKYRLKQIDNDGTFEYSNEVEISVGSIPDGFVLKQNYPNPFNPSTKIKFASAKQTEGTLTVYNTLGKKVAELFNGTMDAGRIYEVEFKGSNLASGIYFYKLQAANNVVIKKMMLVK